MAAPADYFQRIDLTNAASGGDTAMERTGDNVREDFLDAIENIAPTETPFMSGISRGTSKDVYTSWLQDTLAAPNPANALKDGADIGTDSSTRARRVGNICQISGKSLIISGRAEKVDKAGRSSEMAYQLAKASKALKRDMEAILTGNQAAVPDLNGDTATKLGSLRACFRESVAPEVDVALVGVNGVNGGVGAAGYPTVATAGTERALSQTLLDTVFEATYVNGGDPDTIMVSPAVKRLITEFLYSTSARVAALYSDVKDKRSGDVAAQSSISVYIHDFGMAKIVPNRFLGYTTALGTAEDHLYVLDMSMWSVLYLRPFFTKTIAATGDSEKRLLLVDYTLQYKEEMASGVIADINKATAMIA
jgi:hypothetical protein